MKLTDADYQKCHAAALAAGSDDAKLGDWFDQAMRRGIDKALELAAEPICERCEFGDGRARPPNRVGQWLRSAYSGDIYGPIVASRDGKHLLQWHIEEGGGYGFYEGLVANRTVVRIPPKLAGMNADECREPVTGEQWYDLGGKLSGPMADESDIATDDVMGRNRWIKTPPARMGYGRDNQIRSCLARDWSMIQIG